MKTVKAKLADAFEVDGWDVLEHVTDLEWWADEIWELTSRWSPVGTSAFVTFLVDPMWEGPRRKGQAVWAVGCCADYPRDRSHARDDGLLRLTQRNELEAFLQTLNALRDRKRS